MALTKEQIRARKAEMKKAGISYADIDNDSWGPWQEKKYNEYVRSKIKWDVPTEPRVTYGYAMPLSNPTGALAALGTAAAALPIISDPQGAYETARGVMNTVGQKIDSGIDKAKSVVKGLLPGKKTEQSSGNTPQNSGGGNGGNKWGKRAMWAGAAGLGGYGAYKMGQSSTVERNDATTNVNDKLLQTYYDPTTGQMVVHTERGDSAVQGRPNQLSAEPRYVPDSRRQ